MINFALRFDIGLGQVYAGLSLDLGGGTLLRENLHIPDEIVCCQRSVCEGMGKMRIFLRRLAYPCR